MILFGTIYWMIKKFKQFYDEANEANRASKEKDGSEFRNLEVAIENPNFYSINISDIKNSLENNTITSIWQAEKLIRNLILYRPKDMLDILKCAKIDIFDDNESIEKCLKDILEDLKEYPIIIEFKKMLERKEKEIDNLKFCSRDPDLGENDLVVDWEKLYKSEQNKNLILNKDFEKMKIKYETLNSLIQKRAPKPTDLSRSEMKAIFQSYEKKDEKKAKTLFTKILR